MRTTFNAVAIGAMFALGGPWADAQDALFTAERDCTADVWSCARASCPAEDASSAVYTCM